MMAPRYVAYHDSPWSVRQYILYFPVDDGYAQQDDGKGPYPARTYDAGGLQKWKSRQPSNGAPNINNATPSPAPELTPSR